MRFAFFRGTINFAALRATLAGWRGSREAVVQRALPSVAPRARVAFRGLYCQGVEIAVLVQYAVAREQFHELSRSGTR